jgi:hypothetical protein
MGSGPAGNRQMLRERVLAALEHFWSPLRVDDELRPYLEGVWGQPMSWPDCWPMSGRVRP